MHPHTLLMDLSKLTQEEKNCIDVQQGNAQKYFDMQSWLRPPAATTLTSAVYNIGARWQSVT